MMGERLALVAQIALGAAVVGVVTAQGQIAFSQVIVLLIVAEALLSVGFGSVLYWRERIWRKRLAIKDQEAEFYKNAWLHEQRKSDALVEMLIKRGVIERADADLIEAVQDDGLRLLRTMRDRFGLSDLRTLAFDVSIEWENVTGDTLDTKLVGLITAAKRAGKLGRLAEVAERYRNK
jgi:hypothetical protein